MTDTKRTEGTDNTDGLERERNTVEEEEAEERLRDKALEDRLARERY